MPDFVKAALEREGVAAAIKARPPYQRNDYWGWITRAKQDATRDKRPRQMLNELAAGETYMAMAWGGNTRD